MGFYIFKYGRRYHLSQCVWVTNNKGDPNLSHTNKTAKFKGRKRCKICFGAMEKLISNAYWSKTTEDEQPVVPLSEESFQRMLLAVQKRFQEKGKK